MMASLLVHSSSAPSSVSCEPALGQGSALKSSLSTQQECKKQGKASVYECVCSLALTRSDNLQSRTLHLRNHWGQLI